MTVSDQRVHGRCFDATCMVYCAFVGPRTADHRSITTTTDQLFTIRQAATRKGVGYHTVSRAVTAGRLPHQRLGRNVLISPADLDAWQPMRQRRPRRYQRAEPDLSVLASTVTQASLEWKQGRKDEWACK